MPRAVKLVISALLVALIIGPILIKLQSWRDEHLRMLPTIFPGNRNVVLPPSEPVRQHREPYIDDRYLFMKQLGEGMEGKAAVYTDTATGEQVVVKTYTAPARDPLPSELELAFAELTTTWPSEIEAETFLNTLLPANETGYVHMLDYFILRSPSLDSSTSTPTPWSWAMVTPLMTSGTLQNLATSRNLPTHSPAKLDQLFRPALNALLTSLLLLHEAGICHNDIKPDNIFISNTSPTHWLIGDLGNMRHTAHPWHATRTWRYRNQWADCQLNDVRRALKSYIYFLRAASADEAAFDTAFYAELEPWSRLYWQFVRWPGGVERVVKVSQALRPGHGGAGGGEGEGESDARRAWAVGRELTCTTLPRGMVTWWRLGGWWQRWRLEVPPQRAVVRV